MIISDMEGVAGVTRWGQVTAGDPLYQEGRRLYTEELNAAARGAFAAGANDVIIMDCHGAGGDSSFNSLLPAELDARCELVVQRSWTEYTEALEEGCDAAVLIGMHARAGTPDGVLSHTVRDTAWRNVRFNGVLVGETAINAALCGTWGCPVVMVSGDRATCSEARQLLGEGLLAVEVKQGLGRESARHLAPKRARELIEEGVEKALSDTGRVEPYDPGHPVEIDVELAVAEEEAGYLRRPGIELIDSRRVVSRADDWWTAWQQLFL